MTLLWKICTNQVFFHVKWLVHAKSTGGRQIVNEKEAFATKQGMQPSVFEDYPYGKKERVWFLRCYLVSKYKNICSYGVRHKNTSSISIAFLAAIETHPFIVVPPAPRRKKGLVAFVTINHTVPMERWLSPVRRCSPSSLFPFMFSNTFFRVLSEIIIFLPLAGSQIR